MSTYTVHEMMAKRQDHAASGNWEKVQVIDRYLSQSDSPGVQPMAPQAQQWSWGDTAQDVGQEIAVETMGGYVGGLLGSAAGPAGTLAGAGMGALAGNRIYDMYRDYRGYPERPVKDEVMGGAGAMLGGPVGRMGAPEATLAMRKGVQKAMPDLGQGSVQRMRDMEAAGIPLSVGAVSENPLLQAAEQGMRQLPFTSGIIEKHVDDVVGAAAKRTRKLSTTRAGDVVSDENIVGRALAAGGQTQMDRFFNKADQYRRRRADMIPEGLEVKADNYIESVLGAQGVWKGRPNLAQSNMPSGMSRRAKGLEDLAIKDEAGSVVGYEPLTWKQADDMRKQVGERLRNPGLTDDIDTTSLKKLYGALTEDMESALQAASPEARKLWGEEKRYFRRGIDKAIAAKKELVDTKTPELLTKALTGRSNLSTVLGIRTKTSPEAWELARSHVLENMGKAKANIQDVEQTIFSPDTFLTNYANMPKSVRKAMFGAYKGLPDVSKGLDELARGLEPVKEMSRFRNYSNTAPMNAIMQALSGKSLGAAGLGLAALGFEEAGAMLAGTPLVARKLARAFVNPQFVKWLAKANKPELSPDGWAALLGQLPTLAASNPEIQDVVLSLHEDLTTQEPQDGN